MKPHGCVPESPRASFPWHKNGIGGVPKTIPMIGKEIKRFHVFHAGEISLSNRASPEYPPWHVETCMHIQLPNGHDWWIKQKSIYIIPSNHSSNLRDWISKNMGLPSLSMFQPYVWPLTSPDPSLPKQNLRLVVGSKCPNQDRATLPGFTETTLSNSNLLRAGFDQVYCQIMITVVSSGF